MFSKRAATAALTSLSFRPAVPSSRLATRASAHSARSLSSSTAWILSGRYQSWTVAPTRGERIQAFSVSARLSKEAPVAGQNGSFKQYNFEDISSAIPSSPSEPSPPSTPILIDVREPSELTETGIIPTAVCMPLKTQPDALFLSDEEFLTRFGYPKPTASSPASASEAEKEKGASDLVFYCRAGVRAKTAAQLAVQAGYDPARIGVYEGSWLDWEKRKGKVERWQGFE